MSHSRSVVRVAFATSVLIALASACGGRSFEPSGGVDGGSGTGATSSTAGSGPVAGTSSAGRPGGIGGSASAGGATSNGGTPSFAGTTGVGGAGYAGEACAAASDPGPCNAYAPSWYHDASTGICRPFVFGGCGGNANRYASLEDCQEACRGLGPNYDACSQPSDCVVAGARCCGVCDSPSLTKHDFVAYNHQYEPLVSCGLSPLELPAPPDVPGAPLECPGCPDVPGGYAKYFVRDCVQSQCAVADLREPRFTACMVDEDCAYRVGTGCCQGCDPADAIPLRKDASVETLLCDGARPIACAPCPPIDPKLSPTPVCGSDGRCALSSAGL